MKKLLMICLLACCSLSLFALNDTEGIWMQTNDSSGLSIDLSRTIANPNSSSWTTNGYGDATESYFGKVGSNYIPSEVTFSISCSETDSQGNFVMRSSAYPDAYRHFTISYVTRAAVGDGGGGNSHISIDSTAGHNISTQNQSITIPACTQNSYYSTYYISYNTSNKYYHHVWEDFIILMDAPSSDASHLVKGSDYQAVLTIQITSPAEYSQVLTIPLLGYYESEPVNTTARYECSITDDDRIIDLSPNSTDAGTDITIGRFHFFAQKSNSSNLFQTDFQIVLSASNNYNEDSTFKLRRQGSKEENQYNSLPLTVKMTPETPTGSFTIQNTGTSFSSTKGNGTDATGILPFFSNGKSQGDGEPIVQWNYDADVKVQVASSDIQNLIQGSYSSDIYFFIITKS